MAEGNSSYKGLAVPLSGESQIHQTTAATDIVTLTAITGATGDFLVTQTAGGGEVAFIDANGYLTAQRMVWNSSTPTTGIVAGLTKGQMFIIWESSTAPVLGMCTSTAAQTVHYIAAFSISTLGLPST